MLGERERVLKPDGFFYISTPYKSFWGTVLDPAWWLIKHRHYDRRKMTAMIEQTGGLEILHMEIKGGMGDSKYIKSLYCKMDIQTWEVL